MLTLEEKADIIRAVTSRQKKREVVAEHDFPASTLSTILKSKDAAISGTSTTTLSATSSGHPSKKKNMKTTPHEKLEEALFTWFMDRRAKNVPLTGDVVQQKVCGFVRLLGYDKFKTSRSWRSRFQERYSIVRKVLSGQSASVNKVGADDWLSENVPDILGSYAIDLLRRFARAHKETEDALNASSIPHRSNLFCEPWPFISIMLIPFSI